MVEILLPVEVYFIQFTLLNITQLWQVSSASGFNLTMLASLHPCVQKWAVPIEMWVLPLYKKHTIGYKAHIFLPLRVIGARTYKMM